MSKKQELVKVESVLVSVSDKLEGIEEGVIKDIEIELEGIVDDELSVDDESNVNEEVAPQTYEITSYGADYDVEGLVKRLVREDIIIPAFQRAYVWNQDEASRLIESLLLGLPVPGIFLAKERDTNKLLVIDGQQRLKSLRLFLKECSSLALKKRVKYSN